MRTPCTTDRALMSCAMNAVTCVRAKTKTRSKNSSSVETDASSSSPRRWMRGCRTWVTPSLWLRSRGCHQPRPRGCRAGQGGRSGEEQHHVGGHAGRLVVALDLDGVLHDELLAGREVADLTEAHVRPQPAVDRHRAREAHLVEAVVEAGPRRLEPEDLRGEVREQAEGEEAVGDRGAERALAGGVDVDVDPLVVERRVGEGVDPGLVDVQPRAGADVGPGGGGDLVE